MRLFSRDPTVRELGLEDLVFDLYTIGKARGSLSVAEQGSLGAHGLDVRLQFTGKGFRLEAGTSSQTFIEVRGHRSLFDAQVARFKTGAWLELVGPTLALTGRPSRASTLKGYSNSETERILQFPTDKSYGTVKFYADAELRNKLGETDAKGAVLVPDCAYASFLANDFFSEYDARLFETWPRTVPLHLYWDRGVTDGGLVYLASLTNLRGLGIGGVGVTDSGLGHLAGLTNLRELLLLGTSVSDAGLARLTGLPDLRELFLDGSGITDEGMVYLPAFNNLSKLWLAATGVGDEGLTNLSRLSNLTHLWLNQTLVTDRGLAHLGDLANLTHLWLGETECSDDGMRHLMSLDKLTRIDLDGTRVTDTGLEYLTNFPALTSISLANTAVTDIGIVHLARQLPGITDLNLDGTRITDAGVAELVHLRDLTTLWLSHTGVTDSAVVSLTALPRLRWLDVSLTGITSVGRAALKARMPSCYIMED